MKNNINNKKDFNVMKKLNLFLIMVLFSVFSVNALIMSYDQNENIYGFENAEKGNNVYNVGVSSTDTFFRSLNGTNYSYDYRMELSEMSQDFYLILENTHVNTTYLIFFHGDLSQDDTLYTQELILKEMGDYVLKFYPSNIEAGSVFIDLQDENAVHPFSVTYVEEKPKGFNQLIGGLVDTFTEVFNINLKLWYLFYYVIIFSLVVSFIGVMFGFATFLFKKADEQNQRKGLFSNEKPKRED